MLWLLISIVLIRAVCDIPLPPTAWHELLEGWPIEIDGHVATSITSTASDQASGVYLCRLTGADQVSRVQKIVLIK